MQLKSVFLSACILLLIVAGTLLFLPKHTAENPVQTAPAAATSDSEPIHELALFPTFSASQTHSVSICTPESDFDLRRENNELVSVNGRRGDSSVFTTLLNQIDDLSYIPTAPFSTQDTPLLTLRIRQKNAEYSAAFYADAASQEHARILFHQNGAPVYGITDGWRVGTLMLTCEGIRVQDADGRETPLQ